ncbi:Hypothetical protein FKW44_008936, partial [Caligus rogercresseyi]
TPYYSLQSLTDEELASLPTSSVGPDPLGWTGGRFRSIDATPSEIPLTRLHAR